MTVMEVTTKIGCRIRCKYCPQNTFIRKYREKSNIYAMTFDMYKTCIDKIPAEVDIVFAGMSEPFLNSEATRMILYAHERGHKVCVNTTLVGMQIADFELFKNVPFKYFCIHLPSAGGNENIEINDNYLELLDKITKSEIKVLCHSHGGAVNPKVIPYVNKPIRKAYISTRIYRGMFCSLTVMCWCVVLITECSMFWAIC
jgi:MoaA/NifB/PqqE/SkfB family radical SAM enzyme